MRNTLFAISVRDTISHDSGVSHIVTISECEPSGKPVATKNCTIGLPRETSPSDIVKCVCYQLMKALNDMAKEAA